MLARGRLLRFLRLLVALTALFTAQPSTAAGPVVDQILLVASAEAAATAEAPRADEPPPSARAEIPLTASVPALASLQSTRALPERAYLLHCALLR